MRRLLIILPLLIGLPAKAQQTDPDWPCIQVLVPEIVAAVVWPQVIDESVLGSWRQDERLTTMVATLSDLERFSEREQQLIAEFVESIETNELPNALNRLADGILSQSNQRRDRYIDGIKRYTRQQISIANQIETSLNQIAQFDDQSNTLASGQRSEIEETLHWHQRVYDRREKAIVALCERPVELEEILSNVLRELAQYLP